MSWSMSRKKCCVPGCLESGRSHPTMHLFPNPAKDIQRFNQWVQSIGGDIIGLSNEDIYKHRSVCHSHFEEKFCCRFNRLSNIAVPTLNLPGLSTTSSAAFVELDIDATMKENIQPVTVTQPAELKVVKTIGTEFIKKKSAANVKTSRKYVTPEEHKLKQKLAKLQIKISKFHDKIKKQTASLKAAKNITCNPALLAAIEKLPVSTKILTMMQFKEAGKKSKGRRFNLQEKILALSILKQTPKGYRFLRFFFILPAPQTLARLIAQANIKPGINKKIFTQLKNVSTKMKQKERLCILLFDEMYLKANVSYNERKDKVTGFVTDGKITKPEFADHAQVFMLRGLVKNFKQPIAYSFSATATSGQDIAIQIKEIVTAVQETGLIIVATVCDQGANNRQAIKLLTIAQANIKPGINKKIFTQLKNVSTKMKQKERLCILLFDEMYLKANVSYNERKDKVTGFVTDGKITKPEFADHAQVFMLRGLVKNFKQPIAYSFSATATSGQDIAIQIKEIVTAVQETELIIVATVCDQGANNRQAIKLLTQETRGANLLNGQEPKDNIILINNQEIIPLYDPPHLLKCIRNNLLTKNLEYFSDGVKHTAKWEHLILLHKENPGYKGIRLIPKLTENHVLPEKISRNKMKVKFTSQIFSRTVATNMGYLAGKGVLPKECSEPADLLLFFDNLFDSQNGSYNKKSERFAKPLLGPVTPQSLHHKEWAVAKQKLKLMKFVNPKSGKIENVPTLSNWSWTLDGIEVLLKKIENEYNVNSIWMRHLNQDPIENFFGTIRSHGCRNTNPTPENFEGTFVSLLINNVSSVHAPAGANCETDFCENLHALIVTDDCKTTTTCDLDYMPDIVIENLETKNDPRIMGPLQYVSGYFVRMSKKNVFKNCKNCAENVIASESAEYIKYREYAGRQWLCSPTDSLLSCISAVQDITYSIILHKDNMKELIKTHIIMFVDFGFLNCEKHKVQLIDYMLNLTSRFFIYNYCKDLNRMLVGKRDCYDDEDKFQEKAKKNYKKCIKRPLNKIN